MLISHGALLGFVADQNHESVGNSPFTIFQGESRRGERQLQPPSFHLGLAGLFAHSLRDGRFLEGRRAGATCPRKKNDGPNPGLNRRPLTF